MATIFYDADSKLELLDGKTVAVIGYGSQGHAHALNLHESGVSVVVGARPEGRSWKQAQADGLKVATFAAAAAQADLISLLLPDHLQPEIFEQDLKPHLTPGKSLVVAHGFNIVFHQVLPPRDIDVFMIAPKSPGHIMRRMFIEGAGVPALLAVHQDRSGNAKEMALAYAKGIGCTRTGVIETTFKEETETDLFGEQTVLCGGVTELIRASFDTLVEAGYQPEIAYFECLNELKLIVDLIFEGGISWMRYSISDVAEYGDITVGRKVITDETRARMKEILKDIQSGTFAREWVLENQAGRPVYKTMKQKDAEHLIEQVGKKLRAMMPWLDAKEVPED